MLTAWKKVTTRLYLCRLVRSFKGVYYPSRCPGNSFTISEMNDAVPPSRRRILLRSLAARGKDGFPWYERGATPPTEVALEYQAILGKPVSELLGGAYDRAAFVVRQRARDLLNKDELPNTAQRLRRRKTLERIAA